MPTSKQWREAILAAGVEVEGGLQVELSGLKFVIRTGTADINVVEEVVRRPIYTNKKLRFEPGDLWLDIGAHIGAFSIKAAAAGCRVVAYEPEERNLALLRRNLTLNKVDDRVEVVNAAVVAESRPESHVVLWASTRSHATERASILGGRKRGWELFLAPALGFFDEVAERAPRFIKMDAEGAEFDILDALDERISDLACVAGMTYEYHFTVDPSRAEYWRRLQIIGRHFGVMQARDRDIREGRYRGWIDPILKVYRELA